MNEELKRAAEGLKQDEDGLNESDSLLRYEVVNNKLDYLTDVVYELSALVSGLYGRNAQRNITHFCRQAERHRNKCNKLNAKSIEQYKERKNAI